MAKSKNGGTRSYIRGRVGAEVYSLGKDGLGKKQQVVRSIAETVANPQTEAQMRGRMIMFTVSQAVKSARAIIDHSFDGVPTGQPSISQFISRNYELIKADVAAHPASGNEFGLNEYQERGMKKGAWLISSGKAPVPAGLHFKDSNGCIVADLPQSGATVAQFKAAMLWEDDMYFTLVGVDSEGKFRFARLVINSELADDTVCNATIKDTIFDVQEGDSVNFNFNSGSTSSFTLTLAGCYNCMGVIVSKKTSKGYIHSTSAITAKGTLSYTADVALPTYPQGEALFLNGGDI